MEAKGSVVFFFFKILDRLLGVFLVLKTCRADTRGTIGTFTILYNFQFSTNSWNSFFLNCPLFPRYYHMTTPQDLKLFLTSNSGMLKYAKFDTFYYTQPQYMQQPRINKFFFFHFPCSWKCSTSYLFANKKSGTLSIVWAVRGNKRHHYLVSYAWKNTAWVNWCKCTMHSYCTVHHRQQYHHRHRQHNNRSEHVMDVLYQFISLIYSLSLR